MKQKANREQDEADLAAEVDRLEADLEALRIEGETAAAEADRRTEKRDVALLAQNWDEVARLNADRRPEFKVEYAARLLPDKREALTATRARLRDARWRIDYSTWRDAVLAMQAPLDALTAAMQRVDAAAAHATARGNGGRVTAFMAKPPRLPSGGLVVDFELLGRFFAAARSTNAPDLTQDAPPPAPKAALPAAPPPARAARPPEPPALPVHRLLSSAPGPDAEGRGVVLVMRAYAGDKIRLHEIVRLPYDRAIELVREGRADFVDPKSLANPPREIEVAVAEDAR